MATNDITVTILENGTARIETDKIAGPAHQAAEAALLWIERELGGNVSRIGKGHIHTHEHNHTHDHNHNHDHAHQ
jgi:ABC-type Zn2+ transport system substrate-binding protein/surface adhesin